MQHAFASRNRFVVWIQILALILATLLPAFISTKQAQGLQIIDRYVQMSSSAPSATGQTYKVHWTGATNSNIKGIVVDFCSNSPIVGDTCTATPGTNVPDLNGTGALSVTQNSGISGWTAAIGSTDNYLTLVDATGITGNVTIDFDITTVSNHSTVGSFYARILTFPNDSGANSPLTYNPTATGADTDNGGVALSIANQLTVTAKVQETLTFCVYTTGANCAGASGTAVTLGNASGVLVNTAIDYESNGFFGLASNASDGVTVRMKGGVLTTGTYTLTSHGSTCTADSTTTTVEQFGLRIVEGASVTADAAYDCAANSHAFDTVATATTYGDVVATTAGATDESQSTIEFSAKAANATEAGIYTNTFTFIATGQY